MPVEIKGSVCPYDCPDSCGLLIEVQNERAVKVSGDPDHPFTRGSLCGKMNHYERTVHSAARLTEPLLRCGEKGSGEFRPISWDEAIERISTKWKNIIANDGPEAILPYSYAGTMGIIQRNAGHPFFHRMGASLLDRGICTPAKGAGWEAVMGKTPAPDPQSAVHSDLIILWSSNAAATNIHFLHTVKQAKKRGAEVWMIDLYPNPTAKIADKTMLVRPGSDGALALGMMHILVREQLCDLDFINSSVQGFTALKDQILPDYNPEAVSDITGLPVAVIEQMAIAFGKAKAPFISLGGGVSRYINGAMSTRCIVSLPTLTGALQRPGGGCFVGTSTGAAFDMAQIERTDLLRSAPRTINMNRLGDALLSPDQPAIKSLYIYHSNPAAVTPDQNRVLEGLAREDLFTVVHERFMTDSARYADIVLPAPTSLETSDIYRSYGSYTAQRVSPVIPAVGQCKSNLEVFSLLAAAMGYEDEHFRKDAETLIAELTSRPNSWWRDCDMKAFAAGHAVLLSPPPSEGYATESGRIEILNPALDHPLPCYLPTSSSHFPLKLVTAPAMQTLNSTFFEREELRGKGMTLKLHPAEATSRDLAQGELVSAFNDLGEVDFYLEIDLDVPPGLAVAEGVWWIAFAPGQRTVNSLTSQRLTDLGGGSTFYDNSIDVRAHESSLRSGPE